MLRHLFNIYNPQDFLVRFGSVSYLRKSLPKALAFMGDLR